MKHEQDAPSATLEMYRNELLSAIDINLTNTTTLLDLGCGDGRTWTYFFAKSELNDPNKDAFVIGIDLRFDSKILPKRRNLDFITADARFIPIRNSGIEVVFEKDTLHHISNHEKAIGEMKRVTKSHGKLIIIEANRYNPILYFHMTCLLGHEHFPRSYFRKLLSAFFTNVTFYSVEAHAFPLSNKLILRMIHIIQKSLSRRSFLQGVLSYNIAVVDR